jgi:hypothetical protein
MRCLSSVLAEGLRPSRDRCDTGRMSGKPEHPEWLLWLMEHGVRILILLAIAFMAFVYTRSRSNTEARLGAIEARVENQPARAYQAPNLDDFAAKGVDPSSLRIHRAVYVPVYSHIYYDGGRPYLLETTLSIRNVDPNDSVFVGKADYYDTDGKLSKSMLDRLIELKPLQTIEFLVERSDASGGSGANFIVEWHADRASAHAPLIEAVMVGRSGTNAISFVRKSEPLPQWKMD